MITKSTREYFDSKFKRFEQIQDFTTIQTAFLAIVFSLFIFSVTAILINYSPSLTLISLIMVSVEFYLLYNLLFSIFSNQWDTKLSTFSLAIWITVLIPTYIFISYLYVEIGIWLYDNFEINNVGIVIVTFLTFAITIPVLYWILDPRYKKRFHLLYPKPIKIGKKNLWDAIDIFIFKYARKLGFPYILSLIITILTGLIKVESGYGFPFFWFYKAENLMWEINTQNFFLNIIFFTIILYVLIILVKKFGKNNRNNTESNGNVWENSPYYVKK